MAILGEGTTMQCVTRRLALLAAGVVGMLGTIAVARALPIIPTPHIVYYGGPVVSNALVVTVNWNGNVDSIGAATLPQFYSDITANSSGQNNYWNMLGTFDSTLGTVPQDGGSSSGQLIGPGSALPGSITINPTLCPTTTSTAVCMVAEADVDAELNRQIDSGVLPAPVVNAGGNVNTIYMVNFPIHVQLTLNDGVSQSCSGSSPFCNANSTLVRGSQNIAVGFLPDLSSGSACNSSCGNGTVLQNATANASQALVNAVTNPEVGLATAADRPLAWSDWTNGYQLTTPCNQSIDVFTAPNSGRQWSVNQIWSTDLQNALGGAVDPQACRTSYFTANAFGLTAAPGAVSIRPGESTGATISAIAFAGSPQNIQLSTDQLPDGITVLFTPSNLVSASGSSAVQFSADSNTALGAYNINILGVAQTGDRAVTGFVVIVTDVIFSDGFE